MMTIREIESGSDIMEVNRLAGLIWHEAYRGIVSREQIAYMIERGVAPFNILALTFTNKAAEQMRERIAQMLPDNRSRHIRMGRAAVPEQSLPLA